MPDRRVPRTPHRSDLELARAATQGDFAAFHKIFELYLPPVLAFARRHGHDEARARELAREILEAVFGHLGGYRGTVPLAAWVLAVARLVGGRSPDRAGADPSAARA